MPRLLICANIATTGMPCPNAFAPDGSCLQSETILNLPAFDRHHGLCLSRPAPHRWDGFNRKLAAPNTKPTRSLDINHWQWWSAIQCARTNDASLAVP